MDVRNVQKIGNMFSLYLPTSWCKKHGISSKSKVSVNVNTDGTLTLHPEIRTRKQNDLHLILKHDDQNILNKLIVACYINPVTSFKISLTDEMDSARLLDQKKLLNVELVEFDGKNITCESTISISDSSLLLKTMMTKVKNLVTIMLDQYNEELIERYEEEIDRSKLLIEKATISTLTYHEPSTRKAIVVHYIALLAKSLERLTDHLRLLDPDQQEFLRQLKKVIEGIRKLLDSLLGDNGKIDIHLATTLAGQIEAIQKPAAYTPQDHHKIVILEFLQNIVEVLMDWTLTQELEE